MNDWLAENHLARFIVEVVEQLDLSKITREFSGCAAAAYHPGMLLALLVYGYATGIFFKSEDTFDSVAFCFFAAQQHPDPDTLANFGKAFVVEGLLRRSRSNRLRLELDELFVQVLSMALAMEMGNRGKGKGAVMDPLAVPE